MSAKKAAAKNVNQDVPLPAEPTLLAAHEHPVFNALKQWKSQKKVPPVLLLSGPQGCGKREIAYFLAQTLQCERSGFSEAPSGLFEDGPGLFGEAPALLSEAPLETASSDLSALEGDAPRPCGECGPCLRALSGQSLDFKEITLAADSSTLKIDQFREMKESLGFSSYDGSYKIFLITNAEKMTVQAANSLLKILEEPPKGWVFLLTVSDPSLLPTTVVSRCQILRLRPLPQATLRALLEREDIPADRLDVLTMLGEGSITRAIELSGEEAWRMRNTLLQFLAQPQSTFHALIDYAAAEPANFRVLLDQFEQILNDLIIHVKAPTAPYRNIDAKKSLEDHARRCITRKGSTQHALAFWIERSERLFRMRREITVPLNQKVLVQDFLAPWLDAV